MKRVVVIADLHCGHRSGLTPPQYQYQDDAEEPLLAKFGEFQRALWEWYEKTIAALQPIDTLIVNGDALDGKAEKSGGTELITSDRNAQVGMASESIKLAKAGKVYVIKGTGYHVGTDEDWEDVLADKIGAAHVGNHEWIDAEGVIIDCRHMVSGSTIPHGRYTAMARQALWNSLSAEREMQPKANIIIRSHRHFYAYCGEMRWLAISTPALQGWTKFGSNIVEGTNDIGLISIDAEGGDYSWKAHLLDMRFARAQSLPA